MDVLLAKMAETDILLGQILHFSVHKYTKMVKKAIFRHIKMASIS